MNQLFLGAIIPFLALLAVYVRRGFQCSLTTLILGPIIVAASAVWAVVPDIPRAMGMDGLYERMHKSSLSNIFYGHYSIDKIEGDDSPVFAVGILVIFGAILIAAYRELRRLEKL